jgi:hypothetical protein
MVAGCRKKKQALKNVNAISGASGNGQNTNA